MNTIMTWLSYRYYIMVPFYTISWAFNVGGLGLSQAWRLGMADAFAKGYQERYDRARKQTDV